MATPAAATARPAARMQEMVDFLVPREPGDSRDWFLMSASTAIFVYLAMEMFRVYLYLYHAAGLKPLVDVLHPR